MGLELYAKIEEYLGIDEETKSIHKSFLKIIFEKECKNIIDIGCGKGAFIMHLLVNQVKAYGIDLSNEQIKVCKSYGLNANCLDIKDVKDKFDCATAIFDLVNYIPKDELIQFLQNVNNVLIKGAYFIFDVNTLFGFEDIAQGVLNINLDEKFISIDANFEDKKLYTDITLFSKDKNDLYKKEEDSIVQYYYEMQYLKQALKDTNFDVEDIINLNLYSNEKADKILFLCQKINKL